MIDFIRLNDDKEKLREEYLTAQPFPHLVIIDICDKDKLDELYSQIPEIENVSRDLMFAKK